MKRRVLIVEDESDIAELVKLHLNDVCSEAVVASDGREGLKRATGEEWDLVILDLRLPGVDGLDICRRLREQDVTTPVLMLMLPHMSMARRPRRIRWRTRCDTRSAST